MTNKLSVLIVAGLAVFLAGCQPTPAPTADTPAATASPSSDSAAPNSTDLSDIAAEVMGGATYSCSFTNPSTTDTMTYQIQGKKMSMNLQSSTAGNQMSRMINDGVAIYMWDPATKKGMKLKAMTPEELEDLAARSGQTTTPEMPDFSDPAELEKLQQEYKVNCTPATIGSGEFTPPSDVEFQDLSQMLEMMKQYQAPQ